MNELELVTAAWSLIKAGGLAAALFSALVLIVRGQFITRAHHDAVVEVLRENLGLLTDDRDEWRTHATEVRTAVDKLAEAVQLKARR